MSTFLTSIVPVISLIIGTWLGAKFSLRNTLRALEIQNRQKEKERAEEARQNEQKELRSWFERYAIDECVDPLLGEILFLQQFFTRRMTKTHYGLAKEPEVEIPPMPYQACVRIFAISGAVNFTMLASIARLGIPSTFSVQQCQKYMKSLNLIPIGLIRLRQYLVGATITAKNDVHRLCVERRIQALGEMFDKEISEMCGDTETSEISPLTAMLRKMGISTTE